MKYLFIICVWIFVLIIDGVVLVALTNLLTGFGIIIFLSSLIIVFGAHRWVISLGVLLSIATEVIIGTHFGTIIGTWLIMAWGFYLLSSFFNIKSFEKKDSILKIFPLALLGTGFFVLSESVLWAITRFVYEPELTTTTLISIIKLPSTYITTSIEFFMIIFILRFAYYFDNLNHD